MTGLFAGCAVAALVGASSPAGAAGREASASALPPSGTIGLPAVPRPLAHCPIDDPDALPSLSAAYDAGDQDGFDRTVAGLLAAVRRCGGAERRAADGQAREPDQPVPRLDPRVDAVVLVWTTEGSDAGPELRMAVVHAGTGMYDRTLPGIGSGGSGALFQIFLTPGSSDRLSGVYVSQRIDDAGRALPSFAAAISAPVLDWLTPAAALRAAETLPGRAAAWASVARLDLPYRRAAIRAELRARVAPWTSTIERQAERLRRRTVFIDAAQVPCAAALAGRLAGLVLELAPVCALDPRRCVDAADPRFAEAYRATEPSCAGANGAETTRHLQTLRRVDEAFRSLVGALEPALPAATFDLENRPRRRLTLGIATGYVARLHGGGAQSGPAGHAGDAPLAAPRQATLLVVNAAFRGYDERRQDPAWGERLRVFAGAVAAPRPGAGAGLSLLLVRGLAVNAGGLVLFDRPPRPAGEAAPGEAARRAGPVALVRGWLLGLSYNFN